MYELVRFVIWRVLQFYAIPLHLRASQLKGTRIATIMLLLCAVYKFTTTTPKAQMKQVLFLKCENVDELEVFLSNGFFVTIAVLSPWISFG